MDIATAIHDHRGHGESVRKPEDLGYFYEGKDLAVVEDLHQVTKWAKKKFPQKEFYMLGHSMGSLAARVYLKTYDYELDKLVLTGPPCKNPAVGLGLAFVRLQKRIKGGTYRAGKLIHWHLAVLQQNFQKKSIKPPGLRQTNLW